MSAASIEDALRTALSPSQLRVQDDSADHAGHAGALEGSHYSVHITSAAFAGLSRVARHRLVYQALGSLAQRRIHALALHTLAPGES